MKKLLFTFLFLYSLHAQSQSGTWTWMNGDSIPGAAGHFGIQGVPSPANHPPGLYEANQWTDLQGNLWIYGGLFLNGNFNNQSALWKYEPATNMWTWMWGDTIPNQAPVFGVKGVASPTNSPGTTYFGAATGTDNAGNFWLFGGEHSGMSMSNALWKYDPSTNMWTWMSGDNFFHSPGNYGIKGVPSVFNCPASREECVSAWFENDNFWIFGGTDYNIVRKNDLWKYNTLTNEWTWMTGDSTAGAPPVYGTKGISSPANDPGARYCYSHWKDLNDNLWFFGGSDNTSSPVYADMWKYNTGLNEWTWMSGSNVQNNAGIYNGYCLYDSMSYPGARMENKACWTDTCGMFWLFGGRFMNDLRNDLWQFDPAKNEWMFAHGDITFNNLGTYGAMGVPAFTNKCPARCGASTWMDLSGNLWIYGGYTARSSPTKSISDMWRYTPDAVCSRCSGIQAAFHVSDPTLCPGTCAAFFNSSVNASAYQWYFPGGAPDSSTQQNPSGICYNQPGAYDVMLVVSNANGSDTLMMPGFISVYTAPPPQSISQNGDTLFAIQGSQYYQWYADGNLITGATSYYYVAPVSGDYNVIATDTNGCEVEAAIFDVLASIHPVGSTDLISCSPNPVTDALSVHWNKLLLTSIDLYTIMGEHVMTVNEPVNGNGITIDVQRLTAGVYMLKLNGNECSTMLRFIKK